MLEKNIGNYKKGKQEINWLGKWCLLVGVLEESVKGRGKKMLLVAMVEVTRK